MVLTAIKADEGNAAKIARGLVSGAIAGVVASFAMDRFQAVASPLLPSSGSDSEPATEKAADAVATGVTGHAIPDADRPLAGQVAHYAVGIALGAAYGIAARSFVGRSPPRCCRAKAAERFGISANKPLSHVAALPMASKQGWSFGRLWCRRCRASGRGTGSGAKRRRLA